MLTPNSIKMTKKRAFTLVEIMVAISIFSIVALVSVDAFITADRISKKAQAMKTIIDNLHFALNTISFNLQQGGTYHCVQNMALLNAASDLENFGSSPQDCPKITGGTGEGGPAIVVRSPKSGDTHTIIYKFEADQIWYWESGLSMTGFAPITIDNLVIDNLRFYVINAQEVTAKTVPRVFFTVAGVAKLDSDFETRFQLQTVVSERI